MNIPTLHRILPGTRRAAPLLLLTLVSACATEPQATHSPAPEPLKPRRVVLIGVDGLSIDGINNARTPVLDALMASGAYSLSARGVLPTSSSSNWKSMVSGAGPEQHGVTSNDWERDDHSLPAVAEGIEPVFPTVFGQLRQQHPQARIGAFYAWDGFGRLIERSALDADVGGKSDQDTIAAAARYLVEARPDLLFVHLDNVDHIGHSLGHKTPPYYQAVEQADRDIGVLVQAAERAGLTDDTVFIITSDHGGIGYGHGGETLDEIEIPFIIQGAGIKPGYAINQFVYVYDTALTIGAVLDVAPHPAWIGKPITSAFTGTTEPAAAAQNIARWPAPQFHPRAHLYEPAGGLFVDQPARVEITTDLPRAQVRYTLDGSEPTANAAPYSAPFELTASAVVKARAFIDGNGGNTATAFYQVLDSSLGNGVNFVYFEGDDWHFLPTFSALSPLKTGTTQRIRIDDIPQRKHGFGIRFTTTLQIEQAGIHKFYTQSDDGSKLFINGQEVVNNDGAHGVIERAGTIELPVGTHQLRVEYFNEAGGAWLEVFHKPPHGPKQPLDPARLYPATR